MLIATRMIPTLNLAMTPLDTVVAAIATSSEYSTP